MPTPTETDPRPDIQCSCCAGAGTVKLPQPLYRVIVAVREGHQTASEIYEALGESTVKVTSINNRLEDLRAMGFLTRKKRDQKTFEYSITQQ